MHPTPPSQGLYRPEFEKDSCGFGLIAQMDNKPSHWLVQTSINALARLTHRGAVAADGKSGDGCGLLMRKPDAFLRRAAAEAGIKLGAHYGVGMVFLNRNTVLADAARHVLRPRQVSRLDGRPCRRSPAGEVIGDLLTTGIGRVLDCHCRRQWISRTS